MQSDLKRRFFKKENPSNTEICMSMVDSLIYLAWHPADTW